MARPNTAGVEVLKIALPLLILAAGGSGLFVLWNMQSKPASATTEKADPSVRTVRVERHTDGVEIQVDGIVVPFREVALSAEVSGRVKTVTERCLAGKFVRAGELLVEIDPTDYEFEVQRLEAELGQAIAMLEENDVELATTRQLTPLVEKEFKLQTEQLNRLINLGAGVSTATALDQAERSKLVAENALRKMEQQEQMLVKKQGRLEHARNLVQSQLAKAKIDLERCKVTAPVDGMVVSESVEQDSFVQKGASLATVEDTSSVEVKCNLMMEQLWWLWEQHDASRRQPGAASAASVPGGSSHQGGSFNPGGEVVAGALAPATPRFSADAGTKVPTTGELNPGGLDPAENATSAGSLDYQLPHVGVTVIWELSGRRYAWKGHLDRYDGIGVNEKTRTVPCRILIENPRQVFELAGDDPNDTRPAQSGPRALVRGMFVDVRIDCQPRTPLLALPEEAIRPGKLVWLLRDGKLAFEKVKLAGIVRGRAIIDNSDGILAEGERAVVSTLAYAYEGMTVKQQAVNDAASPNTTSPNTTPPNTTPPNTTPTTR